MPLLSVPVDACLAVWRHACCMLYAVPGLQARKMVANIMRLVADSMAPGTLATQPLIRSRFLDWLRDTTLFLRSLAPFGEAFWEVSQVLAVCAGVHLVHAQLWGSQGNLLTATAMARSLQCVVLMSVCCVAVRLLMPVCHVYAMPPFAVAGR